METKSKPHVVVIGAGFSGLWVVRRLAKTPVNITLVDENNYHTFLPLLYQVAAAEIEPEEIAYPIREFLRQYNNVRFIMTQAQAIDTQEEEIKTDGPTIPYDYLILATGSSPNYFSIEGAKEHGFPLRTLEQGIKLRNHILNCFEQATIVSDPSKEEELLTFTIVGGGATGVEFAGALNELIRGPLEQDYPYLDYSKMNIVLIEAGDSLLPNFDPRLQQYSLDHLKEMGVDVKLETKCTAVGPHKVQLDRQSPISTNTTIWTAGMRGKILDQTMDFLLSSIDQIETNPTLQIPGCPNCFAVGDVARINNRQKPLPMTAPVAIQQAETAADNIINLINKEKPVQFNYRNRGTMATIGRNAAVAEVFGTNFTGFPAWILWLSFHLYKLIGFKNRVFVLTNWGWDYLFHQRSVRIILPPRGQN